MLRDGLRLVTALVEGKYLLVEAVLTHEGHLFLAELVEEKCVLSLLDEQLGRLFVELAVFDFKRVLGSEELVVLVPVGLATLLWLTFLRLSLFVVVEGV